MCVPTPLPSLPLPLRPQITSNYHTDHNLNRPRNPHLHLPRRHPQRQLLRHTAPLERHDGAHAADGGEDRRGVAGVGSFLCCGVGAFCLGVAVLSGENRASAFGMGVQDGLLVLQEYV